MLKCCTADIFLNIALRATVTNIFFISLSVQVKGLSSSCSFCSMSSNEEWRPSHTGEEYGRVKGGTAVYHEKYFTYMRLLHNIML